jgi:hypothetical protein
MRGTNYLSLQANIICLLLALIGSTAIIKHPDWFGGTSEVLNACRLACSASSASEPVMRDGTYRLSLDGRSESDCQK